MRRIKKAKITFVSLCPRGKNQMPVLFKDDGTFEVQTLVKEQAEGELTALVYVPEHSDSDGDVADAKVIKEMAHDYLRDSGKVDVRHNGQALTKEQGYVAESFIVQKGDPRFEDMIDLKGRPVDAAGSWGMVIKIDDPELRSKYANGEWQGVSMFGFAEQVEHVDKEEKVDGRLLRILKSLIPGMGGSQTQKEDSMENAELMKALEALTSKVDGLVSKEAAREAEAEKLAKAEAEKAQDKKIADVVISVLKEAGLVKESKEDTSPELKKALEEKQALEERIASLQKGSKQSTEDQNQPKEIQGLSKEEAEGFALGVQIAKMANKEMED